MLLRDRLQQSQGIAVKSAFEQQQQQPIQTAKVQPRQQHQRMGMIRNSLRCTYIIYHSQIE